MTQRVLDPLTRMKPQRGRRIDTLAPVAYAADAPRVRWRLRRFTAAASAVAAIACATVAAVFA